MRLLMVLFLLMISVGFSRAQEPKAQLALVDFDAYLELASEVHSYRKSHLVPVSQFINMMKDEKTIILDARSKAQFDKMHIKGAVNLDFSDFTAENLRQLIPDQTTRILIYCNNNFADEPDAFPSKMNLNFIPTGETENKKLLLALNVPTFINLYGYGYKNVYELADLVFVRSGNLEFEGTNVKN